MPRFLWGFLLGLLLGFPWWAGAQLPTSYSVTVIGRADRRVAHLYPTDTNGLSVAGVDDAGRVAGTVVRQGGQDAALLLPVRVVLPALTPGRSSQARGIADGHIVGRTFGGLDGGYAHAFRGGDGQPTEDLGTTVLISTANAVSAAGLSVGFCAESLANLTLRPCVFDGGQAVFLPTLGGPGGSVTALNTLAVLVGATMTAADLIHATLWVLNHPQDLHPPGALQSRATGVNASSVVVLNADVATQDRPQAYRWDAVGGFVALPALAGYEGSEARAINDAGLIVGQSGGPNTSMAPIAGVRWTPSGTVEALTPLVQDGWDIYDCIAVNSAGVILAYGSKDQADQALLLTPASPPPPAPAPAHTPEPPERQRGRGRR